MLHFRNKSTKQGDNILCIATETRHLSFVLGERHIDFYYEKRHCEVWGGGGGGGGGGGVGVMTFINANIDNYSKSYIKNNKPVNIAQVFILNLSINFF